METLSFYAQYDEALSPPERVLVERARSFCTGRFSDDLRDCQAKGKPFPQEWIGRWAATGMLGLQARREHGGHGASFLCKVRVAQELARYGFAAAFCLNNLQGQATRISQSGSDAQRAHLLAGLIDGTILAAPAMSEPGAGSDVGSVASTATKVEGGWRIDGSKIWITNGMLVDYVTMLVRIGEQLATLLVPCGPAPTLAREEIVMPGARSFRLARIDFRDHPVPDWSMLGAPGEALRASMTAVNAARVHVAAMCVAALHASLCEAVRHCGAREAFGRPLLAHQGLQWDLAEVATRLEAANALVFKAARSIDADRPAMTIAAQCKAFAVDTATWGIERCMRAMGATGASANHRLAMQLAEVRLAAFADGTGGMMLDRVGRGLARDYGSPLGEGGGPE